MGKVKSQNSSKMIKEDKIEINIKKYRYKRQKKR
jgi:hypothetical protein